MDYLIFSEAKIEGCSNVNDSLGNNVIMMGINGKYCDTAVLLYPHDIQNLTKMLGCESSQLVGKNITAVINYRRTEAIGYQGMYIILQDPNSLTNSFGIVSEAEVCLTLGFNSVSRIGRDGEVIVRYGVPTITDEKTEKR